LLVLTFCTRFNKKNRFQKTRLKRPLAFDGKGFIADALGGVWRGMGVFGGIKTDFGQEWGRNGKGFRAVGPVFLQTDKNQKGRENDAEGKNRRKSRPRGKA
jgi:hypothetical protein